MPKKMSCILLVGLLLLGVSSFAGAQQAVGTPNGAYRPTIQTLNASVSAPDQYCALAAMKMFELGGNAIDAGIAATFVSKGVSHSQFTVNGRIVMSH